MSNSIDQIKSLYFKAYRQPIQKLQKPPDVPDPRSLFGLRDLGPDPDLDPALDPDPSINQQKYGENPAIWMFLWLLIGFLSLRNDVNVPTGSKKHKNLEKNGIFVVILKSTDEKRRNRIRNPVYGAKDPDPDPSQNVTDPEHCRQRTQSRCLFNFLDLQKTCGTVPLCRCRQCMAESYWRLQKFTSNSTSSTPHWPILTSFWPKTFLSKYQKLL